jgi:transcriptional antiterminator NusG
MPAAIQVIPVACADCQWFAMVVKPRHEKTVATILQIKGFETFLPLCRRQYQYGRRLREFDIPLFPGYIFCRVDPESWLRVLSTPSVIHVAGTGRTPTPINDGEIDSLRILTASRFLVAPHPYLEAGRRVRVTRGPLAGVEGILGELKDSLQLVVSITMLHRSVAVHLDRDQIDIA